VPALAERRATPEIGLVVAVSLGVGIVGAQGMLWLGIWHPTVATYALSVLSLTAIVIHLVRRNGESRSREVSPARGPTGFGLVHAGAIGLALANWGVSVVDADPAGVSGYGLLAVLEPTYVAALAILAVGFAAAVASGRASSALLAAYVVALVVVIHATAPLVYDAPRYAWTYKHLGVVDAIAAQGAVDRSVDIYQNWPGGFAFVAWLADATALSPEVLAKWAQPAFELAFVAGTAFVLRRLTNSARLVWTAAWLMVAANWIGQDYLSPQALGFVLALGVVGVALEPLAGRAPTSPRGALVAGGVCYLALVMTHQLSPVFVIAWVAALVVLTGRPPPWVLGALVALEAWWVWTSREFVFAHFNLLSFDQSSSARPAATADALPGVALGATASRAVIVLMGALAVAGLIRRRRRGRPVMVPAVLAAVPFAVAVVQSYDGEGPLRAYLFALPFGAFLAAEACRPPDGAALSIRRISPMVAASALILAGALLGYFGQDLISRMDPEDIAASRWFLDHAPAGASLTLVARNYPDRVDRRYEVHLDDSRALIDEPAFRRHPLGPADVPRIAAIMRADGPPGSYLALTPSQERFVSYYGLVPRASYARLSQALEASRSFELVFRRGSARVFRVLPRELVTRGEPPTPGRGRAAG
jgi:hypothetical protein